MIRTLLDVLSRIFLFGRGRPVALLILAGLILLNLLSESEQTADEQATTLNRIGNAFGSPFRTGRQFLFDGYQKQHPREPQSNPVTIVAIDETSLKQIGQWPWPRNRTADLINAIAAHQPAAIGLDIYMPEEDQTSPAKVADNLPPGNDPLAADLRRLPSHETQLAAALRGSPTVLGAAGFDFQTLTTSAGLRSTPLAVQGGTDPLTYVRQFPWVLASLPELQAAASGQAVLSVDMEGGVVRRMPLIMAVNGQLVPGLGMEMLRVATGSAITVTTDGHGISLVSVADLEVPTQANGEIWLHFARFAAGKARYVSAAAVLDGKADPELLSGKLVMIGLTGSGLSDQRLTALGEMVPGIEAQAQVVEAMFDGRLITRPWWIKWLETLVFGLIGGLMIYLMPRRSARRNAARPALPGASLWLALLLGLVSIASGDLLFVHGGLLFDAATAVIILAGVTGSLATSAFIQIRRRTEALAREQQHLREVSAKAAGELSAAGRIQIGSLPLPEQVFRNEKRFELVTLLEPAKDVGGDLYDFFMIDDHQLGFVIGDVSGKGLPASLFMAVTKTLTKTIAKHVKSGPAAVAELANAELSEVNPEALFVTLLVGVLDVTTGELTLVNAGHDGPWLMHRDGSMDHLESPPDAGGPPLCMMDEFPYAAQQAQLQPGDTLVMYTDGITEAMNVANEIYGNERLEAALKASSADDIHALLDHIRQDVGKHVDGAEPSDDMTLLVIRWTPILSAD